MRRRTVAAIGRAGVAVFRVVADAVAAAYDGTIRFVGTVITVIPIVAFPAAWDTGAVAAGELIVSTAGCDISTAAFRSTDIVGHAGTERVPSAVAAPGVVVADTRFAVEIV